MKRTAHAITLLWLAASLSAFGAARVATASPQYGGDCHYCHGLEQPEAFEITGTEEVVDEMKVFEVEPGGSVDFGFNVDNPGEPVFYRMVVRGLDHLDGSDENGTPHNLPRLYTPDESWQTASPGGDQYIFWEGQFYGQGPAFAPATYDYHLEVGPDVEPGVYELTAFVGGGFPIRAPGHTPQGGWSYGEEFQLRVIPEPSTALLLIGGIAVFGLGLWRRRRVLPVALVLMACLLTADVGHAYPSRSGDCAICHSNPGPSDKTGDFEIKDTEGNTIDSLTVAAGDDTEFVLELTKLIEDPQEPGTLRRGYMVVQGLDLLNVDQGPPPTYADIPYSEALYSADVGEEEGQWHDGRYVNGPERYMGPTGNYYAQSSTDPNAVMPFPLSLSPEVEPGDYVITAILAGGRPSDEDYHNGWNVTKEFTLTVTSPVMNAMAAVPEPATLLLLATALPAMWFGTRRRRRRRV